MEIEGIAIDVNGLGLTKKDRIMVMDVADRLFYVDGILCKIMEEVSDNDKQLSHVIAAMDHLRKVLKEEKENGGRD